MTTQPEQYKDVEVCEACGCAGEIGFIIKEGDDVSEITIYGESKEALEAEFAKYLELAKQVSDEMEHEAAPVTEESRALVARFKFTCSAEKLIFELKTRSLAR